ncbi:DUF4981 domain-containing protein [Streptomyces sp. NPDC048664]|uniref:DUF4981 domain-containing protein n=1 Tax=Streptomyces sp. NPDC048664 TaxID=3154505 RepID=UPI00343C5A10
MTDVKPVEHAGAVPGSYGDGADGPPVRMRCFRHEGVVIANHRRLYGFDGLTARWELRCADGGERAAPAELPRLAPGESAAVPLPFALPEHGGETWLTLRVRTARAEPSAPPGAQVCAPRVRLR